tara:strand:+ start:171 stop:599 length:429 start_codon:yes stop_codon:yes gene_type:complete
MIRPTYFFILSLLFSCTSAPEKKENNYTSEQVSQKKSLIRDVMAVHDEAMPWLDEIHNLKEELLNVTKGVSDSLKGTHTNAAKILEASDEAMMAWMRAYSEPQDTVQFQVAIEYLNQEKNKISTVRTQMKSALENAKNLLNK